MRVIHPDQLKAWINDPDLGLFFDAPEVTFVAPPETTVCIEHEGFVAVFHPAPANGVFFGHVGALRGVNAAKAAKEVLAFVKEKYPIMETIIAMIDPRNRAVRHFARRIGFRGTVTVNTKRGPQMILEREL